MTDMTDLASRVSTLRQTFDQSFAHPAAQSWEEVEALLVMRVGASRYAVRLREIAAVMSAGELAPIPADAPHLLGLAGVRGAVVPVFDLAALLGEACSRDPKAHFVLCRAAALGLGFSSLEGHLRPPSAALVTAEPGDGYVCALVPAPSGTLSVLSIPLVVSRLTKRATSQG